MNSGDQSDLETTLSQNNNNGELEALLASRGWPARQLLKFKRSRKRLQTGWRYTGNSYTEKTYFNIIHWLNKTKVLAPVFDLWFTVGVVGTLTGTDQELYCRFNKGKLKPKHITLANAIVGGSYVFAMHKWGGDKLLGMEGPLLARIFGDLSGGIITGVNYLSAGRNVYRVGATLYDGKGREPWGYEPLLVNIWTYAKEGKLKTAIDYTTNGARKLSSIVRRDSQDI